MRFLILAFCAAFTGGSALAQQITAVAVSPDGSTVYAAGDNRTLYTMDSETLTVKNRTYIPDLIREIVFSNDGRRLFLRMDNRNFQAVSAGSFKRLFAAEDVSAMSLSENGERLALLDDNYKGGILTIVAANSGKSIARMEFPDIDTEMVALTPDGSRAYLFTDSDKSDDEEKKNPPSDMKGYDKYLFRQQNDGYISQILDVDIAAGTHTIAPTYYRISFPSQVRMLGDKMAFVNGVQDSGLVSADGTTMLMNLGDSYISAARINDDGQSMVATASSEIRYFPLAEGVAGNPTRVLKTPKLDGPSERVTAMDEAADGTLYMVTSGYRIWKITPDATEPMVKPVF